MPSFLQPDVGQKCARCGNELPSGALNCSTCHALVHSEQLAQLSSAARQMESAGQLAKAQELWAQCLPLLPRDANQSDWIREHLRGLDADIASQAARGQQAPPPENKWATRAGPVGAGAFFLWKAKSIVFALFKLKFLFSLFAFMGVYWALWGWRFGIGFALLILLHEMGHYFEVKRRGFAAELPVFLPGFGAYVSWQAAGVDQEAHAYVSLAGPAAGLLGAIICAAVWLKTGSQIWMALANASAWLNLLNLIPVWQLDGGQAANALSKLHRGLLVLVCVVCWFYMREGVLLLVALGAGFRLFTKDEPQEPSNHIAAMYVALVVMLAAVQWALPAKTF